MSYGEIQAALLAQLDTVSGLPDADHRGGLDNTEYEPTIGAPWFDVLLGPGPNTLKTMPAEGGLLMKDGALRIRLHWPINTGNAEVLALADAVEKAFPTGKWLTSGSTTVEIDGSRSWSGGGGIKKGFYTVPVDVRWHVQATNTLN